jgi:hypothetical protein
MTDRDPQMTTGQHRCVRCGKPIGNCICPPKNQRPVQPDCLVWHTNAKAIGRDFEKTSNYETSRGASMTSKPKTAGYNISQRASDIADRLEKEFGWHHGDIYPELKRAMTEAFAKGRAIGEKPSHRAKHKGPSHG